ncbi:8370_t:CDS:2 [Scutellospora calospora]|uniref:8370_t:CDS:1 n=1 Tax=Scutellospora calospora TaxID=85575 RepID=A0ACA9JYX2_9GLOM|nr:8370_t:CDS:2 [Scutellospora calospora]
MDYEYVITPGQNPVIIINTPAAPSNPPNTPEPPKSDEKPPESKEPNKEDPKNKNPDDQNPNQTPATNTPPIIVMPNPQYIFIPTNWGYLNPYTWCNIL